MSGTIMHPVLFIPESFGSTLVPSGAMEKLLKFSKVSFKKFMVVLDKTNESVFKLLSSAARLDICLVKLDCREERLSDVPSRTWSETC